MLTITTEEQVIYINTNLLKSRVKKAVITLLKVLSIASGFCGAFWVLGTAGAWERLTISQLIFQMLQGLFYFGIAYMLNFVKNALQ